MRTFRKRRKKVDTNSFRYLIVFLIIVGFALIVSLGLKLIKSVSESSFDRSYFNILIRRLQENPANVFLLGINSDEKTLSILKLEGIDPKEHQFNIRKWSIFLGIPIDAMIVTKQKSKTSDVTDLFSLQNVYPFLFGSSDNVLYGLHTIDMLKLAFVINSTPASNVKKNTHNVSSLYNEGNPNRLSDQDKFDALLFEFFKDKTIVNEKVSIEVVNASGINGVGGKISRMLRNVGCNVVALSSQEEGKSSRIIVRANKNYTIERLEKVFEDIPFEFKNETGIADVSIVIGREYAEKHIQSQ